MLDERPTFESPVASDAGMIADRTAQPAASRALPADLMLVSADNHIEVTSDIFYERFPAHLRDQAPRVWFDKYWHIGNKEKMEAYPVSTAVDIGSILARSVLQDGFNMDIRSKHLKTEGVRKEIVYPQSMLAFVRHPDAELQEAMYRTYNEHVAELAQAHSGSFYPVAICGNWWDYSRAEASIKQIVDLGFKSFMLPYAPGKDNNGKQINYGSDEMDRLWALAQEAGLPINFHIGEIPSAGGRGTFGTFFLTQAAPFRAPFGRLLFGGVFDRFPKLQVVFAEGGINWVAGALQDAELTYGAHREMFEWELKHRPTYYWHNNMHASFQTDTIGLRLLDTLGADRVMWAQDYPHSEGTFGYTADEVREVFGAAASEADARKILGENAVKLYKLG